MHLGMTPTPTLHQPWTKLEVYSIDSTFIISHRFWPTLLFTFCPTFHIRNRWPVSSLPRFTSCQQPTSLINCIFNQNFFCHHIQYLTEQNTQFTTFYITQTASMYLIRFHPHRSVIPFHTNIRHYSHPMGIAITYSVPIANGCQFALIDWLLLLLPQFAMLALENVLLKHSTMECFNNTFFTFSRCFAIATLSRRRSHAPRGSLFAPAGAHVERHLYKYSLHFTTHLGCVQGSFYPTVRSRTNFVTIFLTFTLDFTRKTISSTYVHSKSFCTCIPTSTVHLPNTAMYNFIQLLLQYTIVITCHTFTHFYTLLHTFRRCNETCNCKLISTL